MAILDGRHALVTGGGRGIGRAIAKSLSDAGAIVTVLGRQEAALKDTVSVGDAKGYVMLPNVNPLVEQMDMREAQRAYEANLNLIGAARRMIARTLDILRS